MLHSVMSSRENHIIQYITPKITSLVLCGQSLPHCSFPAQASLCNRTVPLMSKDALMTSCPNCYKREVMSSQIGDLFNVPTADLLKKSLLSTTFGRVRNQEVS